MPIEHSNLNSMQHDLTKVNGTQIAMICNEMKTDKQIKAIYII